MANQSQRGGATWSGYMRDKAFRFGWVSRQSGEPLDYDVAKTLGARGSALEASWIANGYDLASALQRKYEAGRLMAAECGMDIPAPAKRQTKEILTVVKACPMMVKQFATERTLAREEAKRSAALRLRLMARDRQKASTAEARP